MRSTRLMAAAALRAVLATLACTLTGVACATTLLVGQRMVSLIDGVPSSTQLLLQVRDLGAPPLVATEPVTALPATRTYSGAMGAVGDPRGTHAFAIVGTTVSTSLGDQFHYVLLDVDTLQASVVSMLPLLVPDDAHVRTLSTPVLDAARGLVYILQNEDGKLSLLRITRNPLAIAARLPVPCAAASAVQGPLFVTADGTSIVMSCGERVVLVDSATGAERASAGMPGATPGYAQSTAYDDVRNLIYGLADDTSDPAAVRTIVVAHDADTLAVTGSRTFNARGDEVWVGLDGAIYLRETLSVMGFPSMVRLDLSTGDVASVNAGGKVTVFQSMAGRIPRIVGTYVPGGSTVCSPVDSPPDCWEKRFAEMDLGGAGTWNAVWVDERPLDDPARRSTGVDVAFVVPTARAVEAVEYVRADKSHYFMTADPAEIDALDRGLFAGWKRTGESIPVFAAAADSGDPTSPVCRFYGRPELGLDTHFYSALPQECAAMKPMFGDAWIEETLAAFFVYPVDGDGRCPNATTPVFRLYNDRSDVNHRYTTSRDIRASMIAQGWMPEGLGAEGVGFCVPRR